MVTKYREHWREASEKHRVDKESRSKSGNSFADAANTKVSWNYKQK